MSGLEIYNSEGIKTFGRDSSVLYYAGTDTVRLASITTAPEYSAYFKVPPPYAISILNDGGTNFPDLSNTTTFYRDIYRPLRQTPLNVFPMESFGLQSWDENGVLELDPRRKPLVVEEIKYVEGNFPGSNPNAVHVHDLWDADGYGVLFLDLTPRFTLMGGYGVPEIDDYIEENFIPSVERVNGRYRLRVQLKLAILGSGTMGNRMTSGYRGAFGKVKTFRAP